MSKQEKQAKYDRMLDEFDKGHRYLKRLKQKMIRLQTEIGHMKTIVDERPDEISMKTEIKDHVSN